MKIVNRILLSASRSTATQRLLERLVIKAQYLMGIGSGTEVINSGENALIRLAHKKDAKSTCIFDVGANAGAFVRECVTALPNATLDIHAFEPSRQAFESLSRNWSHRPDVKLNNRGLHDKPGTAHFYADTAGSELASLSQRQPPDGPRFAWVEDVTLSTLDLYCDEYNIPSIDLLKIDVEGHELAVMRGGSKRFERRAIGIVLFEFGGTHIDTRTFLRDYFDFFKPYGYAHLYRLTPSGYLAPLPAWRELDEQFRTTNFVATASPLPQQ